jgi:branched-chain amino acid aminotransferase
MPEIYINGNFFSEEEAKVSVFDRGFLYGDGVFETLRAYNGKIFRLADHLERMSKAGRRFLLAFDAKEAEFALYETLHRNKLRDALLRLTLTRGQGSWGIDYPPDTHPTMVIFTRPFTGYPGQKNGINVLIADTRKTPDESLDSSIKSLNFLNNIFARREASEQECKEAILLNKDGFVAEGSVSNIFWVSADVLYTPALDVGILPGVTRKVVLELAEKDNIPSEEGFYKPESLLSADEVFITNTGYEIMPVSKVNDTSYQSPGPLTIQLLKAFQLLTDNEK